MGLCDPIKPFEFDTKSILLDKRQRFNLSRGQNVGSKRFLGKTIQVKKNLAFEKFCLNSVNKSRVKNIWVIEFITISELSLNS